MKAHIGVDAESGLVHSVIGTAANVNDVTQAAALLHGEEKVVFADAGYQGVGKREEAKDLEVDWHIAMRPGKRRALDPAREVHRLLDKVEQLKASVRAKVDHPFRVAKQQFGYAKMRYRGLAKNTARLTMLFALSNMWMVRRQLLGARGGVRLRCGWRPLQAANSRRARGSITPRLPHHDSLATSSVVVDGFCGPSLGISPSTGDFARERWPTCRDISHAAVMHSAEMLARSKRHVVRSGNTNVQPWSGMGEADARERSRSTPFALDWVLCAVEIDQGEKARTPPPIAQANSKLMAR